MSGANMLPLSDAAPTANGQPLFTIVTVTFNAGALFNRTSACVQAQTCADFEWIVVDGGSTDDTVQRIRDAARVDRWISEPDRGIPDAWNKGLAMALGQYVLILNAGDVYDSQFLERVARRTDGRRVICSAARVLGEAGGFVGIARAEPRKLGRAMHVPHNWCAVPLSHYRELGGYGALPLAADFAWFHRYWRLYGELGFIVLPDIGGDFYLGGRSDASFAQTFREQQDVVIAQGGSRLKAVLVRLAYTLKHRLKGWVLRARSFR